MFIQSFYFSSFVVQLTGAVKLVLKHMRRLVSLILINPLIASLLIFHI